MAGGTNTFDLRVNGGVNLDLATSPSLKGVNVLNVTNLVGATTVDGAATPDMTELNNVGSLESLIGTNLATTVNTFGISNQVTDDVDFTMTHLAGNTGASDSLQLNLMNAGTAAAPVAGDAADVIFNGAAAGDGFDIVNVKATGANRLEGLAVKDNAASTMTNLNVTGSGSLQIENALDVGGTGTFHGTINATQNSGGVRVTLNAAENIKFTGGSGNDRVDAVATLTAADVLDGGTGSNTISQNLIASVAAANYANVTNFQTLAITGEATGSLNTSFLPSSITTYAFEDGVAAGFTSASKMVSGDTVSFNTINADVTDATFALATATGYSDVLNLKVTDQDANKAFTKMTTTGFKTVNLDVKTGTDAAVNTLTLTEMVNADLETLNITGDEKVTLGGAAWSTGNLSTLDASEVTQDVTVTGNVQFNNSGATLKTGSGNDNITFNVATNATLAVDAGTSKSDGTDTLTLTGAQTGETVVDLSAADQITKVSGVNNAPIQTGFDDVTAAAITGAGKLTLTGNSDSNTIIASTAGTGATTINGGDGVDFITAGAASTDTIVKSATTAANASVITGFEGGTDVFKYTGSLTNDSADNFSGIAAGQITTAASLAAGIAADDSDLVYITTAVAAGPTITAIDNLAGATAANYDTLVTAVENALLANEFSAAIVGLDAAFSTTDEVLMTLHTTGIADGNGIVIRITNTDTTVANTLTADEIEIVGTFNTTATAAFAEADFTWAA